MIKGRFYRQHSVDCILRHLILHSRKSREISLGIFSISNIHQPNFRILLLKLPLNSVSSLQKLVMVSTLPIHNWWKLKKVNIEEFCGLLNKQECFLVWVVFNLIKHVLRCWFLHEPRYNRTVLLVFFIWSTVYFKRFYRHSFRSWELLWKLMSVTACACRE
jgi:hypothetical protein